MRARNRTPHLIRDAIVAEVLGETMAGLTAFKKKEKTVATMKTNSGKQTKAEHLFGPHQTPALNLAALEKLQAAVTSADALNCSLRLIDEAIREFLAAMVSDNVLDLDLSSCEWLTLWQMSPDYQAALRSLSRNLGQVEGYAGILAHQAGIALRGPSTGS